METRTGTIRFNKDAIQVIRREEMRELARQVFEQLPKDFNGDITINVTAKPRGKNDLERVVDYIESGNLMPLGYCADVVARAKARGETTAAFY